jgi:hypothetical protein
VFNQDLFKHENNLTVGASYDYASVHFESNTELAALTESRGTIGSGIYVDESKVRLNTNTETVGAFFTDSFSITDGLTTTIAGRFNHIGINLEDQYINDPLKTLNGSHTFDRFNPSAGLTYQIRENLGVYGSYSESTRAPTPMELSCADPAAPCKLPNSFLSDPPLKQVVAKTWEGGFRGDLDKLLAFSLEKDADLVVGDRGRQASSGLYRNIGKWMIRRLAALLMPIHISDINSGFKLYRTELVRRYLSLCPDSMAFSDVIALVFIKKRHLVLEHPITIKKRASGKSTIEMMVSGLIQMPPITTLR